MFDSIENSWRNIESLTQAILATAHNQRWDAVLELSSQRHLQLQTHFSTFPVGPENAEFYRPHIDVMLRSEGTLQKIIMGARKALMSEGVAAQKSNRAAGAYLHTAMQSY